MLPEKHDHWDPLRCDVQRVCPITFQGLLPLRCVSYGDMRYSKDFGNIPSDVPDEENLIPTIPLSDRRVTRTR